VISAQNLHRHHGLVANPSFSAPENGGASVTKQIQASPASIAIPIEVMGTDLEGRYYMERTQTLMITSDGATILLANKLAPESELVVRNIQTNEEAPAQVIGHIREDISGHVYGVGLIDPSIDLWGVPLSRIDSDNNAVLECSHCQAVKSIPLTEIETIIFKAVGTLPRHCKCSNSSTIWKQTCREVSTEQRSKSLRESTESRAVPTLLERRKNKRTAMKSAACIRYAGKEEIVQCEDMSRGGFRFISRKPYPKNSRIEVAVPYMKSNINIFVPARVVYYQQLSPKAHRHGMAYLEATGYID
jgi:hypothetical protein